MNGHFDPAKVLKSCKFDRVAVFGNDKVLTWLNSTNKMSNQFCIWFRLALKWMSLVLVQKSVSKRKIKSTGNKSLCFLFLFRPCCIWQKMLLIRNGEKSNHMLWSCPQNMFHFILQLNDKICETFCTILYIWITSHLLFELADYCTESPFSF